eukprot:13576979-Alexandrium_andersonii.AAC.1
MSASLVGSEMCIRDRSSRARARAPSREGFGVSAVRGDLGSVQWKIWPSSVSYTHLTLPTICSV